MLFRSVGLEEDISRTFAGVSGLTPWRAARDGVFVDVDCRGFGSGFAIVWLVVRWWWKEESCARSGGKTVWERLLTDE